MAEDSNLINKKATILMVHGLNNNSKIFSDIKKELEKHNYITHSFQLSGHLKDFGDQHTASKENWLNELRVEMEILKNKYNDLPVYAIGYSLGGLLLVEAMQFEDFIKPKKLVLLAPALKVKPYTKLVRLLFPFGFINFSLPSLAPEKYLAYNNTSVQSYRALFGLIDDFQCRKNWAESLPNTLVISHLRDLLIAHIKLKNLFLQFPKFKFYERNDDLIQKDYTYHHIFAKEAFSQMAWDEQINTIIEFLD